MKPAAFDYVRIGSPEEALAIMARSGEDARVLAGGQSLMPILNMRLAQPSILLDISRCVALDHVRIDGDHLVVGAAATQRALEWRSTLTQEAPLLAQAIPHISHFQIRNRGTVCGSIAHADPSAELPLCLAALAGEVTLRSPRGQRSVPASAFFLGPLVTDRHADEMIIDVRFPLRAARTGYAFEEFSHRHGDYAIVAAAAVVNDSGIRLAIGGVAAQPVVAQWPALAGSALDDAINEFAWALDARDDAQASAKVRRHLVRELGRRAIARAARAAMAATDSDGDRAERSPPAHAPSRPTLPAQRARTEAPPQMRSIDANARHRIALQVNGEPRSGEASSRTLLTDFLRHGLGLTGTHVGCEHGVCGACTVRIDGIAQRACLTLAVQTEGLDVQTIESPADDDGLLTRLRTAFKRHHALQCGYCTAGILMSCVDFLTRVERPDEARIREFLSGHLCRCTGYTPIVAAIREVADATAAPWPVAEQPADPQANGSSPAVSQPGAGSGTIGHG